MTPSVERIEERLRDIAWGARGAEPSDCIDEALGRSSLMNQTRMRFLHAIDQIGWPFPTEVGAKSFADLACIIHAELTERENAE